MFQQNKIFRGLCLACLPLLCACSDPSSSDESLYGAEEQKFMVKVESIGETPKLLRNTSSSSITSITPVQSIDQVVVLIMNRADGRVVYKKTFSSWSDTNNKTSVPYVNGEKRGREAEIVLQGANRLKKGVTYVVYAVGYHTGTYNNYVPFENVQVGDLYKRTELAELAPNEKPSEIFAGAQTLVNENGRLVADARDSEIATEPAIRLRRQVAGTFGYFTSIPVRYNDKPVASLRLVASRRNQGLIFAGFRSQEDPNAFNQENVINGFQPRSDYDAVLHDASSPNAFTIYEIQLKDWFPGETLYPKDQNGDGFLDGSDANWTVPQDVSEDQIKLERGAVYASRYLVPVAMTTEEVAQGLPTFELQALDAEGNILKYWRVDVRALGELRAERTLVEIDPTALGQVIVRTESSPESETTYSISRNSIYTLGEKNSEQSYGEDTPIILSQEQILVVDINPEWKTLDAIIFN
ncbi:MAG: hypothetical protein H9789_05020 [Candidatus Paraprevotella stercoravium]|uniref:Major fimbrial subunit protein N-terminal domain-containing protein n=1 Tax=Candidatus Paraprevotella stercoravium TaxID=2838725 RepID=A0A9E2L7I0_9BACT|nr:hypothetical protein [Candidatus Paraprevotella stercoravium]